MAEYLALYRKYRPQSFKDVIGQPHITTTLGNQITNNQISHAYLFCGTRGTGKTSVAKIFAKAINCLENKNGNPCNVCSVCKGLNNSSNLDVLEIDAASNNGVDNIRDLRENIKYPPVVGKYKVYIIDEVHMLSESAFNALLKTLEEPPSHAIFILATTEVQKLPATILSRCIRFDFRLISIENLSSHIQRIFEDSKIQYEKEALPLLASLGEGSVRDALSIADMCVAYSNNFVTYQSILDAIEITGKDILHNLASFIVENNIKNMLEEIDKIANKGKSIPQLNKDLVEYFRDMAIVKTCSNYKEILKYPEDIIKDLEKLSEKTTQNKILSVLQSLGSLEQDFRYTNNQRALFEISILGLFKSENDIEKLENKVKVLEDKINNILSMSEKNPSKEVQSNNIDTSIKDNNQNKSNKNESENLDNTVKKNSLMPKTSFTKSLSKAKSEIIISENHIKKMELAQISNKKFACSTKKETQYNHNKIFGKLLSALRIKKENILYAAVCNIKKVNINNNKLIFVVDKDTTYKELVKKENENMLKQILEEITPSIELVIKKIENTKSFKKELLKDLKEEFGQLLVIEN